MKEIEAENLEKLVAMTIGKMLYNYPDYDKIIQDTNANREIKKLKTQLRGKENAINNTLHAIESGMTDELKKKLEKLNKSKESIQSKINEYNKKTDKKSVCKNLIHKLKESESPEAREFLKNIIDQIEVDHDSIKVTLNN